MTGLPPPSFASASALSAPTPLPDGRTRFTTEIPDLWQQGPGAYGGLVLGILARGLETTQGDATRLLRSLSGEILVPVTPGPALVDVEILRRGKGMTLADARLVRDGAVLARASAACGAPRAAGPRLTPARPRPLSATDVDAVTLEPPLVPVFTQHLEFRPAPPFPFSRSDEARASGFIRWRRTPEHLDAAHMIGLLDAWWPAAFATLEGPRAMATIAFTAELLVDPATIDPAEPLRYEAHVEASADGYAVEFRQLWSGDIAVALNQQTIVSVR